MEMKDILPYFGYFMFFVVGVFVILWGISIYFVKTKRLSARQWSLRSLGLPQGSVRALIAFIILFLVVVSMMLKEELPDLPDWLVGILGTVIGFYFGTALVPRPADPASKPDDNVKSTTEGNQADKSGGAGSST